MKTFIFRSIDIYWHFTLGSDVYEAVLEGVTTSVVKLPLVPGKSHVLYFVAVDNVGNSQSLQDVDPTTVVVPNGI